VTLYKRRLEVVNAWEVIPYLQEGELAQAVVAGLIKYCEDGSVLVKTPRGVMQARPGDFIVCTGLATYYTYTPEQFHRKYEPATFNF
jgi:diaminopimelate decarboxylase